MEWKLFDGDVPHVSTFDFHKDRERAPHWEQSTHKPRLEHALNFVLWKISQLRGVKDLGELIRIIDLGCGDGGLLQQLMTLGRIGDVEIRGYDWQPSNIAGWAERGLLSHTYPVDFIHNWSSVPLADVYVITEVLEHLADPHEMVRRIRERFASIVCSSPWTETRKSHDECHAWAWDMDGYAAMIQQNGFNIEKHEKVGMFQVVVATPHA